MSPIGMSWWNPRPVSFRPGGRGPHSALTNLSANRRHSSKPRCVTWRSRPFSTGWNIAAQLLWPGNASSAPGDASRSMKEGSPTFSREIPVRTSARTAVLYMQSLLLLPGLSTRITRSRLPLDAPASTECDTACLRNWKPGLNGTGYLDFPGGLRVATRVVARTRSGRPPGVAGGQILPAATDRADGGSGIRPHAWSPSPCRRGRVPFALSGPPSLAGGEPASVVVSSYLIS